jgi:hypothetical protein
MKLVLSAFKRGNLLPSEMTEAEHCDRTGKTPFDAVYWLNFRGMLPADDAV